ncbi:hypothetical protein L2E82_07190 [Cichorium intybus]|uniref:Uncharacterized protein n=1 Tax=Cichorium intybus TaxID=13427 RepID=A0ACB9G510_CICIN|nr:hypothetical protein L2E82_07190 [Cichorium intybus]
MHLITARSIRSHASPTQTGYRHSISIVFQNYNLKGWLILLVLSRRTADIFPFVILLFVNSSPIGISN